MGYQGRKQMRASQSFTPDEVAVLNAMLSIVMQAGNGQGVAKHPGFPSTARKIRGMRARVEALKSEDDSHSPT
jgi:hypothetical protein